MSPIQDTLSRPYRGMAAGLHTGMGRNLRIEVARNFKEIEKAWRDASAHSACYVFQTYDWLATWHSTAGLDEGVEPLLVRVADSRGHTLLLIPLGMRRAYGFRFLVHLGGPVADYAAPILDRQFAECCSGADFEQLWLAILACLPPVDLIWLVGMPETVEGLPNPMIALPPCIHMGDAHAAEPLPSTFEAYMKGRPSGPFKDMARCRRRLESRGPVSFEILEDATDIHETVALALQFKRQRYPKTAPSGTYEEFYYRMSQSSFDSGRPHVSRLRVGKEVVAVHVGALNGSRFYYLLPGYDVRWSRYSVGRLLLQELVRWCILERLATFDMTVGREHYKRFWTDTLLPLHSCRYGVTPKGSAAMALVRAFEYTLVRPYALAKQNPRIRRALLPVKHRLLAMKRDMKRQQ